MRILVVSAHPVETSFVASLHHHSVSVLRRAGHDVDDCDLYAEGFDPVMRRAERLAYHDVASDRAEIDGYLGRIRDAQALLFVHPVWNFGMPAILKGFLDRLFVPGVAFAIDESGRLAPKLDHLVRYGAVCTYGASSLVATLMGNPPKRFMQRGMRGYVGRACPCSYLACHDMNRTTPESRAVFIRKVEAELTRW
ncbi:NAD(P)H-dependent oxidoreductase [Lichenihabitans sp. Uapishka_5]|uniref:NAD(P)H-dependent oxidoreductase n=1 Tax=Lichenihabitans sp. Uapishka_5 TaxID=3037302 RepID=UPI0029E8126A|nr:NAD(P)H-dependent oxidoreductase [Lichenihabitans sp. Uapishka_5]MDX7949982.1 NAD(P)H-dependent oxidoreductase [Lichenihabitans sp. Uapishka_5]